MSLEYWPAAVLPNSISINLTSNSRNFNSSFNNSVSSHRFPGSMWMMSLNFDSLDNFGVREIDILQSFLWSLDGVDGRFYARDFSKPGIGEKGTPTVNGNDQYGGLLSTKGWLPNQLVIPRGKYFSVNDELKYSTQDIWSNDGGIATLTFTPWLRNPPKNNDAIITSNPRGIFRLADNDQGMFDLTPGLEGTTSIEIVEAFSV